MRITYKGDYALKAVLDLALHYEQELVTIHEIAARIDAPVKFMEQVLAELKKGGFVESRRGKVGGYLLARNPEKITLGEVVRFMDGPLEPISCLKQKYANCGDVNTCVFRDIWQKVGQASADIIDRITFAELVRRVNSQRNVATYAI